MEARLKLGQADSLALSKLQLQRVIRGPEPNKPVPKARVDDRIDTFLCIQLFTKQEARACDF